MAISFTFTPRRRKSSCPKNTTQPQPQPLTTTRQFLADYHPTPPSDNIQESDLEKTLMTTTAVDLSKFHSEVPSTFLGLMVNLQEDPIPIPIPPPAQESDLEKTLIAGAVDLSKFRSEVIPSTFLGLSVVDQHPISIPPPAEEESRLALVPLNQNSKRKSPATTFDDEADKKKQRKKKVRRDINSQPQAGPIDLSPEFLQIIEPAEPPVFLYRKCLTPTDVDRDQNRLRINDAENVRRFITRDEEHEIFGGPNNFIEVIGVDCRGRGFNLRLSIWGRGDRAPKQQGDEASTSTNTAHTKKKKNKPPNIVFNRQWCDLLETNGVKADDIAQLWGFRREDRFCLAANFIHRSPRTYAFQQG